MEDEGVVKGERIKWIDCAKAVAIMAVVIDHCNGVLYTNPLIANASYFSVSLFILLSGLSTYITSFHKRTKSISQQIKKICSFFGEYAIATFIIYVVSFRSFDLLSYISYVINFTISGPFYFFVFFFQILLISPMLLSWCKFCENQKYKYIWHAITVVTLGYMCSIFIRYTNILPLHGGGKYMFGGTYLLIYYIGILFGNFKVYELKKTVLVFIISLCGWIFWLHMGSQGILPFDNFMQPYWGDGFNPPSIKLMISAILMSFICCSGFNLFDNFGGGGKLSNYLAF